MKIFNIAHRGWSARYPENTLPAFRGAVEAGADLIELDVQCTRDGHAVVLHDTTVDRTTDGSGRVCDFSLQEVKRLDCGGWFSPVFRGERVPTLGETIEALKDAPVKFCVEVKGRDAEGTQQTVARTIQVVQEYNVLERCILTSFLPEALTLARRLEPLIPTALDPDEETRFAAWDLCAQVLRIGGNILSLRHDWLTQALVDEVHAHGIPVWTWTVNEPEAMRRAVAFGVDGIMTDDPAGLREILSSGQATEGLHRADRTSCRPS